MNTLTIKNLATHAMYGGEIFWNDSKEIFKIGFGEDIDWENKVYPLETLIYAIENMPPEDHGFKLLLRPLSSLTKEIEHNGEKFVPMDELRKKCKLMNPLMSDREIDSHTKWNESRLMFPNGYYLVPYWIFEQLLEWHFDVFRLIEKGLALNMEEM